jgi:hypothetical protein
VSSQLKIKNKCNRNLSFLFKFLFPLLCISLKWQSRMTGDFFRPNCLARCRFRIDCIWPGQSVSSIVCNIKLIFRHFFTFEMSPDTFDILWIAFEIFSGLHSTDISADEQVNINVNVKIWIDQDTISMIGVLLNTFAKWQTQKGSIFNALKRCRCQNILTK